MGICCSSNNQASSATPNPSSVAGISQTTTTSNGTSSLLSVVSSNVSGNSQFSSASSGDDVGPGGQILPHPNLKIYSFAELKSATKNFRNDTVLGEGGFGKVHKGWLEEKSGSKHNGSGSVIAVKKLNSESMQGFEEWQAEVNFLGRLSHPNLVKLLGYCYEGKELLLVYEFMQKGSLENHLFGRGSTVQPLPWDLRLKILIGAARGLAFLHALERQVIYRDFKASNILLDGSYNAKLSDFGLAKMASASQSHVTTRVMGTYGYAAPEYVTTGHLYVKSDVYGFGVVLVEMLTGMRTLDPNRPVPQRNLVDWVKPMLANRRKLKNIMDSRLEGRYPSKATGRIAQLAFTCLETEPKSRPSMKEVVETLERLDAINEKPKVPRTQNSNRNSSNRYGLQPLHHRSPLHVKQDVDEGSKHLPKGS
ncbi:probable serine/threonine-protein kinase PIX13 isoform X1 [Cynara cardunculus var. scolymus]|uniref:probable serine/threonine-protein kinase PIX13 isoform X1 n=1 Tax=Cynara cardunculus var. scolymus TaxID=59895 RepID=UPI000D62F8E4|nr:probable serine/threonine-protein kinase PIX13 isoform X1 [Cynara cardunculus var. scolymus]